MTFLLFFSLLVSFSVLGFSPLLCFFSFYMSILSLPSPSLSFKVYTMSPHHLRKKEVVIVAPRALEPVVDDYLSPIPEVDLQVKVL